MFQSRSPRFPVRFDAVVDDGSNSLSAPVINLSDTGLFLETTTGLREGTRVRIIPLTDDPKGLSEFEGEVVRVQDPTETGGVKRAPGIAVRFTHLLAPDKERLRTYCRRVLSKGTANDNVDSPHVVTRAFNDNRKSKEMSPTNADETHVGERDQFDSLDDLSAEASLIEVPPTESERAFRADLDSSNLDSAELESAETDFFAKGMGGDDASDDDSNDNETQSFSSADTVEKFVDADAAADADDSAPYVYSDEVPKEREGSQKSTFDSAIWGALAGASLIVVVGGLMWTTSNAQIRSQNLETSVIAVAGAIAQGRADTTRVAKELRGVASTQRAFLSAQGKPRATGVLEVTPIGDGANALVQARFTLDNPGIHALDVVFSRTRLFMKEMTPQAVGQAPLELLGPLEKGAKGWVTVVDDATRAKNPDWKAFALNRTTKKRLAKARLASAERTRVPAGDDVERDVHYALAVGNPAVLAVVQEWYWVRTPARDVDKKTRGRIERTTRLIGIAGTPSQARR